jgi:hypothetical protein
MSEAFDLDYVNSLFKTSVDNARQYVTKFFIPLNTGLHAILEDGKYNIVDKKVINDVYFNRMPRQLREYYFNDFTGVKTVVCKLNQERFTGKTFNICPKIKAIYSPYEETDEAIKVKVNTFLKYIKEVLANNNEEVYVYLLKWFSNALKGNKNDSCLYMKGGQGIGKSTISDFLKEFVVGEELFLETGSKPLTSEFNSVLYGKLFVQFSELENFNASSWHATSSRLKRIITSKTFLMEGKNKDSVQVENINNYLIDSNNDSIKDDEGRRFFILDVSHKYKENHTYFGKIHRDCFNDEVGSAFYSFMLDYNTTGFFPQNYPITESKLLSFVKRLDPISQFLKEEYVLKTRGIINVKPKDLFIEFSQFCGDHNLKKVEKYEFIEKLKHLQINISKCSTNIFKVKYEELKAIAEKHKWIHELDEFENSTLPFEKVEPNCPTGAEPREELNGDIQDKYEKLLFEKEQEIEELKKLLLEKDKPKVEKKILKKKKLIVVEDEGDLFDEL